MKKISITIMVFVAMLPFFGVSANESSNDCSSDEVRVSEKMIAFSFREYLFVGKKIEKSVDEWTWLAQQDKAIKIIENSGYVDKKESINKVVVDKKTEKQQKIDELKDKILEVIPIAESVKYPTNKLKLYYKQLDNYKTWDIQKLTANIRKEIQKLHSFLSSKK